VTTAVTLITPAVMTTLLVIPPPPPSPPVTATPPPCQQHTDTMENGVASTRRGAGVQGMPENFIFLFSLLTMLLQCPPPPHPSCGHTHTPPSTSLTPPLTPNNQNKPMGARFGCSASSSPTQHTPSGSSTHAHEKHAPGACFSCLCCP